MPGEAHIPAGWPLWSLAEDAVVELRGDDGERLVVRGRWGEVEVTDNSPLVREALSRMSLGPVKLENIAALQQCKNSAGELGREWLRLKQTLDQLGGLVVPSLGHDDGGLLLSIIPITRRAVFALPAIDATAALRLLPGTAIEIIDGVSTLVCAGAPYRAVLHRPPTTDIARRLLAGECTVDGLAAVLHLAPPRVADVIAYLMGAGLVVTTSAQANMPPV
jgi:hypothetical protein